MNATDIEKIDTKNMETRNPRLVTILLILLIIILILLIVGIIVVILMMSGEMMAGGMMNRIMGLNGQTMNNMISACTSRMQNFQNP